VPEDVMIPRYQKVSPLTQGLSASAADAKVMNFWSKSKQKFDVIGGLVGSNCDIIGALVSGQ
jgi:hypothetical protein